MKGAHGEEGHGEEGHGEEGHGEEGHGEEGHGAPGCNVAKPHRGAGRSRIQAGHASPTG